MPISVGVIGTGWVGSSVAMSVLNAGFASELLLADARHEVAEGEAMDLAHGAPFYTELGHTSESYADPLYLEHLLGGIIWASTR